MSGFQEISSGSFSQGNSRQIPQNCAWCSRVQACTLHRPDSAHSGTRPSASMQPGHLLSSFFGHSVQHSPHAVTVEKSVMCVTASLSSVFPLPPSGTAGFPDRSRLSAVHPGSQSAQSRCGVLFKMPSHRHRRAFRRFPDRQNSREQ